jgi:hypothetical protein
MTGENPDKHTSGTEARADSIGTYGTTEVKNIHLTMGNDFDMNFSC